MQRRLERFDAKLVQSGLDALLVTGQNIEQLVATVIEIIKNGMSVIVHLISRI